MDATQRQQIRYEAIEHAYNLAITTIDTFGAQDPLYRSVCDRMIELLTAAFETFAPSVHGYKDLQTVFCMRCAPKNVAALRYFTPITLDTALDEATLFCSVCGSVVLPSKVATVQDHLLLASLDVPFLTVAGWTPEERAEVSKWALLTHLSASDNDDVDVPKRPSVLADFR